MVACPGRLLDLIDRKALTLKQANIIVLDEADRMADMGFMEPVCKIIEMCSKERQTILFSATLDDEVSEIVENYQNNPITIEVGPEEVSIESMEHYFWKVKNHKRVDVTADIVRKSGRSIVFCKTRRGVDRLEEDLIEKEVACTPIHGGLNQNQRDRAMRKFSTGRTMVLIATDVASRGIDIEGISHVINYELPNVPEDYIHRIGRTARAGASGTAISMCAPNEQPFLKSIEKLMGCLLYTSPSPRDMRRSRMPSSA